MSKKKLSSIVVALLLVVLTTAIFGGCGKKAVPPTGETKTEVKSVEQVINFNLPGTPDTLDPALNAVADVGSVILTMFEGLTKTDSKGNPIAGAAESWEVSEDGLTYTFHLRDSKWSDGQSVKAGDFEYAWKRVLDPKTASDYAYQMFYLKNGAKYNAGKGTPEEVGVKAKDDKTLEVTLEHRTPYFLSLVAFYTFAPVRQDLVDAEGKWSLTPSTCVGNGPFKLTEFLPKDKLVIEKNVNYWNASDIKLEKVKMLMNEDPTSTLAAFRAGQLDMFYGPPAQESDNLIAEGVAKVHPLLGTYYYVFNLGAEAEKINPAAAKSLKDVKVRQALSLAIDRKALAESVVKGGHVPATTFIPSGIPVDETGKDFKQKDYIPVTGDVSKAKQLLAEAGYPDGKGFPELTFLYNTNGAHAPLAVAIQDMWKKNLGINLKLEAKEFKVYVDDRMSSNFLISRSSWAADYIDPMTFSEVFMTGVPYNDPKYSNAEYDKIVNDAKKEMDKAKRYEMLQKAEEILMNDMPLMPIYYYNTVLCSKPNIKGVTVDALGFINFEGAYVE